MTGAPTLRRRIAVAFVSFVAAVCIVFGVLSFLFVYAVEDAFFDTLLEIEARHVAAARIAGGDARPRLPFVQLHETWASVPAEVRANATERAREAAGGEGRHYHLRRIALPAGDAWLVAEVSSFLVVRTMRGRILMILIPATALVLACGSIVAAVVARRSVRQLTELVAAVERGGAAFPPALLGEGADHEVRVLTEALEAAFARVQAMLQREKAFVGDVSHELRTPVAVIRGASELLERGDLEPLARAQLGRIRDAARSSEEVIELLLALAREETARETPREIALLPLVEKLVLRHGELLARDEVEVDVQIAPPLRIVAPPTAAEVVISNLVANALRHGAGHVTISARGGSLTLRNAVSGGGAAGSQPGAGRGIGLHLVRRLCDACGFALAFSVSESEAIAAITFAETNERPRASDD